MKWKTITWYVDKNTGELLQKKHITKELYIVEKTTHSKNIQINMNTWERHYVKTCIKQNQLKLTL